MISFCFKAKINMVKHIAVVTLIISSLCTALTKNSVWKYFQQLGYQFASRLVDSALIILDWLTTFSPSLGFLSDIVAYQAAIVAIAIPVSLEIVSRISERYQSGVITKEFNKQWQVRVLPSLAITDGLFAVVLKFFISSDPIIGYWKFLVWLVFLAFIGTNVILLSFFKTLKEYTTDTKFLLNRLFNETTRTLQVITAKGSLSEIQVNQYQAKLIDIIEGIGDILVFEIKSRKNNKSIINSLRQLNEKVQNVFELQQTYPEIYQKLLLSKEFFAIQEQDQHTAEFSLSIFPEKYQIFLTANINQLIRSQESALEVKNYDIARLANYHLVWLLEYLSQKLDNSSLIETMLQNLARLRSTTNVSQDDLGLYLINFLVY